MTEMSDQSQPYEYLNPKQILCISLPSILFYCIVGMPAVGYFLLDRLGVTGDALDIGQHIYNFSMAAIILCLIPAIIIKKKYGISLASVGTQAGNVKLGRILLAISIIAIPILYIGSADPALQAEYPLSKAVIQPWGRFILYELLYGLLYYVAYEFHFRGVLQLGLSKSWPKWQSIALATFITTFIHWIPMGKPISEILGAFAVGILFGILAEKTDSWYYIFAIHFLIGISTDTFCSLRYLGVVE